MQAAVDSAIPPVYRILIIENDLTLAATLRYNLQKQGHHVTVCGDGFDDRGRFGPHT